MKPIIKTQLTTDLVQLAANIRNIHEIISVAELADVIERTNAALEEHPLIDRRCVADMRREGQAYEIARRRGRVRIWGPLDGRYWVGSLSSQPHYTGAEVSLIALLGARTPEQARALYDAATKACRALGRPGRPLSPQKGRGGSFPLWEHLCTCSLRRRQKIKPERASGSFFDFLAASR